MIYTIKFTIYCIMLVIIATLPLIIAGILQEKNKKLGYIIGFLYIPWFVAMGLLGVFNKSSQILLKLLNL